MILVILLLFCLEELQSKAHGTYGNNPTELKGRLTVKGKACIFPFSYRGVVYTDCAPGVSQPSPWCATSTKDNFSNTMNDWEICVERIDAATCKILDQDDCKSQSVKKLCPQMCSAAIDNKLCKSLAISKCRSQNVKESCPQMCSQGVDDKLCKSMTKYNCKSQDVKESCPQMCSQGVDGKICKSLLQSNCRNEDIKELCPQMCSAAVCDPICVNGQCTANNKCSCNIGWMGHTCDEPVCNPSCVNGQCIANNKCSCNIGWMGYTCDQYECSEADGFFSIPNSIQCFKVLDFEVRGTWQAVKFACEANGLVMAEPKDEITLDLQQYLYKTYAKHEVTFIYWINARGDGSNQIWQRQQKPLRPDYGRHLKDNLWFNQPKFTEDYCEYGAADYVFAPHKIPYDTQMCSLCHPYALCERP